MKVHLVTIEYTVTRVTKILHNDPMTDEQLKDEAFRIDTETEVPFFTAPVLAIRRLLKNSPSKVTKIEEVSMEREEPNA